MYHELNKNYFLEAMNLPSDYHVDAVIAFGTSEPITRHQLFQEKLEAAGGEKKEKLNWAPFEQVQPAKLGNKRIWFATAYGGALLSEILHVSAMFGSKVNLLIGMCGGLKHGAKTGDLVFPAYSYGNESSTRFYQRAENDHQHFPNEELITAWEQLIPKEIPRHHGPTTTCQAMLAERWEDITGWSQKGYIGVEMEASTVFAVSNKFNIPCAALTYIIDNLIEQEIIHGDGYQEGKDIRQHRNELLMSTALKLIQHKW